MLQLSSRTAVLLISWSLFATLAPGQSFDYIFDGVTFEETKDGETVKFSANAQIDSRGVQNAEAGAEAWSMAIRTLGCNVLSVSTEGTASDVVNAGEGEIKPGEGFVHMEFTGNTAVLAVVRDLLEPDPLPPLESPHDVLILNLEGREPCTSCLLAYEDGIPSQGRRVDNIVTSAGNTVRPGLRDLSIDWRLVPCTDPPVDLDAVGEQTFTTNVSECAKGACFAFDAPVGEKLILNLTDTAPVNRHDVYIRWGERPTRSAFDLVHVLRDGAKRIVIPSARAETCFVWINPTQLAQTSTVQLTATLADLALASISPIRSARGRNASVLVRGAGFRRGVTEFSLQMADGEPILPVRTTILSSERAEVVFFLSDDLPTDQYDLHAVGPSKVSDSVSQVFEVVPNPLDLLTFDLGGANRNGRNRLSRMTLTYRNVGTVEQTAPLFLIRAQAPGVSLRLEQDEQFVGDSIPVFGIDPNGFAGQLAPGVRQDIPILFEGQVAELIDIEVLLFTADVLDKIDWNAIGPPGTMDQTDWEALRAQLPAMLGTNWKDFHETMAAFATRLSRRGVDGASLDKVFRFVAREVLGRPSAAVVGRGLDASTRIPLEGVTVVALQADEARSSATTDSGGNFAIDWLVNGEAYSIRLVGHSGGVDVLTEDWTEEEDLFGLELLGTEEANAIKPGCSNCDEAGLPDKSVVPDASLFTAVTTWTTEVVGAVDPNDKGGPEGEQIPDVLLSESTGGFIGPEEEHVYTIRFENLGNAPAKTVVIKDRLTSSLDPSTIRLLDVRFAGHHNSLDQVCDGFLSGGHCSTNEGTLRAETSKLVSHEWQNIDWEFRVDICAEASLETGLLLWTLQTLERDPITLEWKPPEHFDAGFLLPNNFPVKKSGLGEGYVSFSAKTFSNIAEDTVIPNDAFITFDDQKAIRTPVISNLYSNFLPPEPPLHPVPGDGTTDVEIPVCLLWDRPDNAFWYDLYLWPCEEGQSMERPGDALHWVVTGDPCFCPPIQFENLTRYCWQVVARNKRSDTAEGGIWTFMTIPPCPGVPGGLAADTEDCSSQRPLLTWDPVDGVQTYELFFYQVGEPIPKAPQAEGLTETVYAVEQDLDPEEYNWFVRAVGEFCTRDSKPDRFTICSPCPEPPKGLAVDNLDVLEECESARPALSWDPVEGAEEAKTTYSVFIYGAGEPRPEQPEVEGLSGTTYTPESALDPGTYEWQVHADCPDDDAEDAQVGAFRVCGFVRGNSNSDEALNLTDGVFVLLFLFSGGEEPPCHKSADADDDGVLRLNDGVYVLRALFAGGALPPAPFPECGVDPTPDDLSCQEIITCLE